MCAEPAASPYRAHLPSSPLALRYVACLRCDAFLTAALKDDLIQGICRSLPFAPSSQRVFAHMQEAEEHGDMVVVRRGSGRGYRSIVYKVLSTSTKAEHVSIIIGALLK